MENNPNLDSRGKFKKGNKASPGRTPMAKGGKPGALQIAAKMLDDALPEVVASVIKSAIAGDMQASKMIFDKRLASLKQVEVTGMDASKLPTMIVNAQKVVKGEVVEAEIVEVLPAGKDKGKHKS